MQFAHKKIDKFKRVFIFLFKPIYKTGLTFAFLAQETSLFKALIGKKDSLSCSFRLYTNVYKRSSSSLF